MGEELIFVQSYSWHFVGIIMCFEIRKRCSLQTPGKKIDYLDSLLACSMMGNYKRFIVLKMCNVPRERKKHAAVNKDKGMNVRTV